MRDRTCAEELILLEQSLVAVDTIVVAITRNATLLLDEDGIWLGLWTLLRWVYRDGGECAVSARAGGVDDGVVGGWEEVNYACQ